MGRNDPCQCGSGKKFKKCCGNEATLSVQRNAIIVQQREELLVRLQERNKHPSTGLRARGSHDMTIAAVMLAAIGLSTDR